MKTLFYLLSLAALIGCATWAYSVNYETRAAARRVAALETQIAEEAERIEVLKAEWAYLNRPDRLHRLSEANFDMLRLGPVHSEHYAEASQVAFPPEEFLNVFEHAVSTSASEAERE